MRPPEERWQARRGLSFVLRGAILVLPVGTAVLAGYGAERLLPRPAGLGVVAWAVAVLTVATLALSAMERLAHRALPLAILLRLTMVFPDRAPSRLSVARRASSIPRLQDRVRRGGESGAPTGERVADLVALAAALSAHDRRTRAHSERVRALTRLLGEQLGVEPAEVERLEWAGFLHDIGKLAVPAAILNKAGPPDEREWEVLRRHPEEGAGLVGPLEAWLGDWAAGIRDHHEHFDGSGYPRRLSGGEISWAGRIVSVTDSFETMTATRAYSRPMSTAAARGELVRCSGSHFDPQVVRGFLEISLGRLGWTLGLASLLAFVPFVGRIPHAGASVSRRGGRPVSLGPVGALSAAVAAVAITVVVALGPAGVGPAGRPAETEHARAPARPSSGPGTSGAAPAEVVSDALGVGSATATGPAAGTPTPTPSAEGTVPAAGRPALLSIRAGGLTVAAAGDGASVTRGGEPGVAAAVHAGPLDASVG